MAPVEIGSVIVQRLVQEARGDSRIHDQGRCAEAYARTDRQGCSPDLSGFIQEIELRTGRADL